MEKVKHIGFQERREKFLNINYKTPLKQILSYLWEYKKLFRVILTLGIVQSILFLTFPLLIGPALDVLVNPSIPIGNIFPVFITILIIQSIVGILFGLRIYSNRWIGANVIYNLRNDLFSTIQVMSWSWLDENKTGDLISRTTSDVNLLKEFLQNNFQLFIRQCVTFFLSLVILFFINFQLAFFVLIISPVLFYTLLMFRRKLRPIFKKSRETYAKITHTIQENVQGITVVKAFGREINEIKKFRKENEDYYKDSIGIIKLQANFDPLVYLLDNIAFLIVIILGGLYVLGGNMTFGTLFSFIMVLNFSVEPLYSISRFLGNMPQISETCERVTHILNSKENMIENDDAIEIDSIKGEIEFKNVSFSFGSENSRNILTNLNFKIEAGENVAILGSTGSGKSVLVKLIPRFYDVSQGEILIDGINIKDLTLKSLRKQIGFVSQERLLFSRSIKDNIAFGNKNITLGEVKRAALASDINNFIEKELPEKYDTVVSERGMTVSGGQKQRIAIARALAIKPKILILDDATSSVDVDTEFRIQNNFKEIFKDTTTFLITQRLSTVRNADRILVLDKGAIVQLGTHEELMNQTNGIYKKLYLTLKIEEKE
ncbi:MAG: putative multidrug export ATP-binding/permease protein [Candidatus Lokiarchaeum sp. GC14_75]|nr:MAG: putative multidrug export ATP-binding/permease protein [Candidatus Lokiarchaeum sp. GC14_75]